MRPDGRKELVAVADGYREDTDSWAEVLRDLRDRGMTAPYLAVGDGALGVGRAAPGPGCRDAGVAMAYKLLDAAQARWRRINAPERTHSVLPVLEAYVDRFDRIQKTNSARRRRRLLQRA